MARAGRAFATFRRGDAHYLVAAGLLDPPQVMRWRDGRFEPIQELAGLGARELAVVEHDSRLLLIRVNFILGSPADPHPSLLSQVYEWHGGAFRLVAEFPTTGGTDVSVVDDGRRRAAVRGLELALRAPALRQRNRPVLALDDERPRMTAGPPTASFESAELVDLFLTYSASPASIGAQFVHAAAQHARGRPADRRDGARTSRCSPGAAGPRRSRASASPRAASRSWPACRISVRRWRRSRG